MCLLVLAWNAHPQYRLIVAANRDEYHERPSAALAKWPAPHEIVAGRDLRAGGTWLGVDRRRRFGSVTNFRDLQPPRRGAPSRGGLIPNYLSQPGGAQVFLDELARDAASYSGFNVLLTDGEELWYASNRAEEFGCALPAGVYGLSNQFLDAPAPKLVRVRRRFEELLRTPGAANAATLFALLDDREPAPPDGGNPYSSELPPELLRALSAPFVLHPRFGTRCSTVLLFEPTGAMHLAERRFDSGGALSGESAFTLAAGEWPQSG